MKISVDKMQLTVTEQHPVFSQKEMEEEKRRISAQLYQIFRKYKEEVKRDGI